MMKWLNVYHAIILYTRAPNIVAFPILVVSGFCSRI